MRTTTEKGFRVKIRKELQEMGVYREAFETTIQMMAEYYVRSQQAKEEWKEEGGPLLLEQTNKGGSVYYIRHPLLQEIDNCSKMIMTLKRDLGLTPKSIHTINEAALGKKPLEDNDPLALALGELKLLKTGDD